MVMGEEGKGFIDMEGDDIYFDDDRTKQFYEGRGKFL
jgi:hypothetical protein